MIKPAPIAFFAYNRFEHTVRTLNALARNVESKQTTLYFFLDGPKTEQDQIQIKKIFDLATQMKSFKKIILEKSEINLGLSKSITGGIAKVLESNDKVIVLEDDILVSKHFLEFMNIGLELYEEDPDVAAIHAYVYPTSIELPESFFLKGSDCWGWGTWKRAWQKYNHDSQDLLNKINNHNEKSLFDFDGFGGYIKMLEDNVHEKNDSWAIRWYASTFLEGMHTLYPGRSLVRNIGMDGSGTHSGRFARFSRQKILKSQDHEIRVEKIPVQDCNIARKAFLEYFRSSKSFSLARNLGKTLKNLKKVFNV